MDSPYCPHGLVAGSPCQDCYEDEIKRLQATLNAIMRRAERNSFRMGEDIHKMIRGEVDTSQSAARTKDNSRASDGTALDLDELERALNRLDDFRVDSGLRATYLSALRNAAPELIRRARELPEAQRKARLMDAAMINVNTMRDRAEEAERERDELAEALRDISKKLPCPDPCMSGWCAGCVARAALAKVEAK